MFKWYGYLAVVMVLGTFGGVAHADPREEGKALLVEWNALQQENARLDEESTEIAKLESDLNIRLVALKKTEATLEAEETKLKSDDAVQAWMQKSIAAQVERKAIMEGAFVRVEKRTKLVADTTAYQTKKQDWLQRAQVYLDSIASVETKEATKASVDCADVDDTATARACLKQYWTEAGGKPVSQPASP